MKKILITLCLIAYICSATVISQEKLDDRKSPCDGTNGTQAEANACARLKYKQAEAEMNRVYKRLITELSGYGDDGRLQEKLRRAQSLWLRYRDANCDSEALIYQGGSIRPAVYNSCLASMTEERTKRMKTILAEIKQ